MSETGNAFVWVASFEIHCSRKKLSISFSNFKNLLKNGESQTPLRNVREQKNSNFLPESDRFKDFNQVRRMQIVLTGVVEAIQHLVCDL